jgi:leucyl aminopeptidase (aminopeptidase T)
LRLLQSHGEKATNLAELGVGTNDRATLTGNVLEDQKILGTVHVALAQVPGSAERSPFRFISTWS